jgi:hypothetical protein
MMVRDLKNNDEKNDNNNNNNSNDEQNVNNDIIDKKIKFFVFLVNYISDEYGELSHQPTAPITSSYNFLTPTNPYLSFDSIPASIGQLVTFLLTFC